MKRSELRNHIFELLFSFTFNDEDEMPEQMSLYTENLSEAKEEELKYIRQKTEAIMKMTSELDELIDSNTVKWKTERMNKVDLTILRLAVYEMLFDEDIPVNVAINEAVELAKKYSGDQGPSFVNGVLAKVYAAKIEQ